MSLDCELARMQLLDDRASTSKRRRSRNATQITKDSKTLVGSSLRYSEMGASWKPGIASTVLDRAGEKRSTKGVEQAARLLRDYGWSERTWSNRASQLSKGLSFCDEDELTLLSAFEGDVMTYIGDLSFERGTVASSITQFISAISRYHHGSATWLRYIRQSR